jgi:hypothetical protein
MQDRKSDPEMAAIIKTFRDLGLDRDDTMQNLQRLSELADSDWPVRKKPSDDSPITRNNTRQSESFGYSTRA